MCKGRAGGAPIRCHPAICGRRIPGVLLWTTPRQARGPTGSGTEGPETAVPGARSRGRPLDKLGDRGAGDGGSGSEEQGTTPRQARGPTGSGTDGVGDRRGRGPTG